MVLEVFSKRLLVYRFEGLLQGGGRPLLLQHFQKQRVNLFSLTIIKLLVQRTQLIQHGDYE